MTTPDRSDPTLGVYGISVAAELAGVAPQTLRLYENKGLLDPDRTAGGTRRYSPRDLDRVEQITSLTAAGLNLSGIQRVLELEAENQLLRAELAALHNADARPPDRPDRPDRPENTKTQITTAEPTSVGPAVADVLRHHTSSGGRI